MDQITQVATAIVVFLLMIVLIFKGIQRKDFSVLGEVLACFYMIGAVVIDLVSDFRTVSYIHMGIFILLFSFLATHLVYLLTGRFKQPVLPVAILEALNNLKIKYDFIVNHSVIGIYVLDRRGRFEFVNKRMEEITGYTEQELLKMSAFDLALETDRHDIEEKFLDRISGVEEEDEYIANLKTKSGEIKKVKVNAKRTVNGHPTITGSITPVEG